MTTGFRFAWGVVSVLLGTITVLLSSNARPEMLAEYGRFVGGLSIFGGFGLIAATTFGMIGRSEWAARRRQRRYMRNTERNDPLEDYRHDWRDIPF